MARILAFAGSLRKNAYSKRVLNAAIDGAREAGAEVTLLDLGDYPMPLYNADDDFDANALRFQDVLKEHDGLIISSPEYNGSLPGGMKNAIDWASRVSDKYTMNEVFAGKTAAMITSSPGAFGGLRCLAHLRGVLTIMGVNVLPVEIAVSFVGQKFDDDGWEMTDEKFKGILANLGASLAKSLK
ncbi:MAG TPA: NAD(P)H-dependent oxidoreductase [Pyrinomonadaceae bacterium]|nr:NAD(P)H-dependent oxidoreductase [Pyrinomonadaceae bacterium]